LCEVVQTNVREVDHIRLETIPEIHVLQPFSDHVIADCDGPSLTVRYLAPANVVDHNRDGPGMKRTFDSTVGREQCPFGNANRAQTRSHPVAESSLILTLGARGMWWHSAVLGGGGVG
jgi:hypothetical protein